MKGGEGEEEEEGHHGPNKCIHSSHSHYYDRRKDGIPDCENLKDEETAQHHHSIQQDESKNHLQTDSAEQQNENKDNFKYPTKQQHQPQQKKRCCNATLQVTTDCRHCKPMNRTTGTRRDSDADVENEGGDDGEHDDHDIDTGKVGPLMQSRVHGCNVACRMRQEI